MIKLVLLYMSPVSFRCLPQSLPSAVTTVSYGYDWKGRARGRQRASGPQTVFSWAFWIHKNPPGVPWLLQLCQYLHLEPEAGVQGLVPRAWSSSLADCAASLLLLVLWTPMS